MLATQTVEGTPGHRVALSSCDTGDCNSGVLTDAAEARLLNPRANPWRPANEAPPTSSAHRFNPMATPWWPVKPLASWQPNAFHGSLQAGARSSEADAAVDRLLAVLDVAVDRPDTVQASWAITDASASIDEDMCAVRRRLEQAKFKFDALEDNIKHVQARVDLCAPLQTNTSIQSGAHVQLSMSNFYSIAQETKRRIPHIIADACPALALRDAPCWEPYDPATGVAGWVRKWAFSHHRCAACGAECGNMICVDCQESWIQHDSHSRQQASDSAAPCTPAPRILESCDQTPMKSMRSSNLAHSSTDSGVREARVDLDAERPLAEVLAAITNEDLGNIIRVGRAQAPLLCALVQYCLRHGALPDSATQLAKSCRRDASLSEARRTLTWAHRHGRQWHHYTH